MIKKLAFLLLMIVIVLNANEKWEWPVHGPVTQGYNEHNHGLDIAVPEGTPVLASRAGIVGGMSGIGTKEKTKAVEFLAIHYTDKDGKDETAVFRNDKMGFLSSFASKVNEQIGFEGAPIPNEPYEI